MREDHPVISFVIRPIGFLNKNSLQPCKHRQTLKNTRIMTMSVPQTRVKPTWECMQKCGACCFLGDYDDEVLREMLQEEKDVIEYLGMISESGWCKWFDKVLRTCTKYEDRPRFCRATPDVFQDLYEIEKSDFDESAISFCESHIDNTYGEESDEALRYKTFKTKLF